METSYKNRTKEIFYFDNNGTTFMHALTKNVLMNNLD